MNQGENKEDKNKEDICNLPYGERQSRRQELGLNTYSVCQILRMYYVIWSSQHYDSGMGNIG